ncbi:MAG TPA: polysaccharide deacetylase family protein, partial [Verrucomicrobiae bacterium]|nr:polysaccharide deacetylase family protein [Verrucomicrobiae bacterium]
MISRKLAAVASALLLTFSTLLPLAMASSASADSPNLIANASVETADPSNSAQPQSWLKDNWGTNKETYTYLKTGAEDGTHAVKVQMTSYTSGDAKWYFTPVNVTAGSQYNFSDYYQGTVATDVVAQFDDGNGNYTYQDLGAAAKSTTWKQYAASLTVPAGAVHVTVFHLIESVGTLTTDNFSLTAAAPVTPPPPPTPGSNLIANQSVETASPNNSAMPQSWLQDKWGTNKVTYSYPTTGGQDGKRSVKLQMTSYTSGDAKWYFTPVAVQQNTLYTYSDYYQSNVASDVVVQFDDGNGNYTYQDLGSPATSTAWKQFTATFTPPSTAVHATVFHLLAKVGTLTTDNFSLTSSTVTPPPPPPPGNAITNPSVETPDPTNSAMPQSWLHDNWGTNTPTYTYLNGGAEDGSRAMQIQMTSYTSGDAKWYFKPVTVPAGTTQYAFSDYYKASVSTMAYAVFDMSDGSTLYQIIGQPGVSANWQKFATNFTVPAGAVDVTVYHLINQVGTLTTDNFSLAPYTPTGFNRPIVTLTFDDGYQSTYDNGLPELNKYGFKSTQYIITGLVGQPNYMTKSEVLAWNTGGHDVESHTVTHPDLTQLTAAQLTTELSQSQSTLQSWLGKPVKDLAYPY